jgi:hypothetical protein
MSSTSVISMGCELLSKLNRVISAAELPVFIGRIEEAIAPYNGISALTEDYNNGKGKRTSKCFQFVRYRILEWENEQRTNDGIH